MKYSKKDLNRDVITTLYKSNFSVEEMCKVLKLKIASIYKYIRVIEDITIKPNDNKNINLQPKESLQHKENKLYNVEIHHKNYNDIINDYKNAMFKSVILAKYKISGKTLYKILKDNNIELRK